MRKLGPDFLIILLWSISIFGLAEGTNWVLSLKPLNDFALKTIQYLEIDLFILNIYYKIYPYLAQHLDMQKIYIIIASMKNWLWLTSFALFAGLFGYLNVILYRYKILAKTLIITCFLVTLFKLMGNSYPYPDFTEIEQLIAFINEFYLDPAILFLSMFLSMFIGSEIRLFWRANILRNRQLDPYQD